MNPFSNLRALSVLATLAAILTTQAQAILDTNENLLSDLWEKQHNSGNLFASSILATNDEDLDGWTNAQEAAAGTDPFNPNPPDGIVTVTITRSLTPGAFTLNWATLVGKSYQLKVSTDLTTWTSIGAPITTTQNTYSIGINTIQPDTTIPPKVFWQVVVSDLDTDTDRLTNYEEFLAGTNHLYTDTDFDGVSDHYELSKLMDALFPDSDGDGVRDADELDKGTDPRSADSHPPIWLSISRYSSYSVLYEPRQRISSSSWREANNLISENITESITQQYQRDALLAEQPFTALPPENANDEFLSILNYQFEDDDQDELNYDARGLQESRIWIKLDQQVEEDIIFNWLKLTEPNYFSLTIDPQANIEMTIHEQIARSGENISEPADLSYSIQASSEAEQRLKTSYIVLHRAPDILAVNSDFDEGRIDPVTNYAIPDCDDIPDVDQITGAGNTQMVTHAERDHLEGRHKLNEVVTEDMHPGWFGLSPLREMPDDFWDDAEITIRKIDKIDADTGYKESGQVRFYATWHTYGSWGNTQHYGIEPYDLATLEPKNLTLEGINGRSLGQASNVYGPDSPIPSHARFFMEGVRPGKITLEWKYKKGSQEAKYEQTFRVETHKSANEWREEVRYQIRLQTKTKTGSDVDVALYHPGNGFRNTSSDQSIEQDNVARVQAIYYYYKQLFEQMPDKFMWAGMAKTAAAPIYAGMSDMTSWWQATDPIPPFDDRDVGVNFFIKGLLLSGQKAIFTDKAWAHRAYMASGIEALNWVQTQTLSNPPTDFVAWEALNSGVLSENQVEINLANLRLLQREQRDVVQPYYFDNATTNWMKQPPLQSWLGAVAVTENSEGLVNTGLWLSANAKKNPMPGGPKFHDVVPGGRIDFYNDRWAWTNNTANGMAQIWTGDAGAEDAPKFDAAKRMTENNKTMYSAASEYTYDAGGLPIE